MHADFAGPLEISMFLVVVDAFSKWPKVIQMKSTTTERTIEVLLYIFARNGLPEHLVMDNGPQFVSEQFEQFMSYNGIRHTMPSKNEWPCRKICANFETSIAYVKIK